MTSLGALKPFGPLESTAMARLAIPVQNFLPVTSFLLPADLPPGTYRLDFKTDFGDSSSAGGSSIVRVGTQ
jgi:hypothetical protein